MTSPPNSALTYEIKEPADYMGGFVATGMVAIIQTATPLLLGQLWKKDDLEFGQMKNPWFTYMWKAMQTGGVVGFGLQSLGFFATLMFDLNIFEKLGYLMMWLTHGVLLANLSFVTVLGYVIVALATYTESAYVGTTEMWITLATYVVVQGGLMMLAAHYAKDTVMYMVAEEMQDLCTKFGAMCNDYGLMSASEGSSSDAVDGSSLNTDVWDW